MRTALMIRKHGHEEVGKTQLDDEKKVDCLPASAAVYISPGLLGLVNGTNARNGTLIQFHNQQWSYFQPTESCM